jgi:phosphoserine aminotransferase
MFLLAEVIADFNRRGINAIRKETEYKSTLLYDAFDKHPMVSTFVQDKNLRSKTVVVAQTGEHTEALTKFLQQKGMHPGDGYGSAKKTQLRFANFPTHSKEQYELLVDSLAEFGQ